MEKVTFLLGAGASAKALPVVKEIPTRLKLFRDFIHDNRSAMEDVLEGGQKQKDIEEQFLQDCDEIINLLNNKIHSSIDTYAKRLRLTAPRSNKATKKYNGLKAILSSFFIYEQLINRADSRYDSFLASILGESHTDFPKNVRILTWNYDFQLEKAFSVYSGKSKISENQQELFVFESGRQWMEIDNFGIYKLNGTTNFINKSNNGNNLRYVCDDFNSQPDIELVKKFINIYNGFIYNAAKVRPSLSFAWESDWENETREFLEKAALSINNTKTLVVIGYSFPFFNRQVDRKMIAALGNGLSKVYIQDLDADAVADNFSSVLPNIMYQDGPRAPTIITKNSVEQFFLPPEL